MPMYIPEKADLSGRKNPYFGNNRLHGLLESLECCISALEYARKIIAPAVPQNVMSAQK